MTIISVTDLEGGDITSGATVRWLRITPWIGAVFQTHVAIPGGNSLGKVYHRGRDNRVATVTGRVLWNGYGGSFIQAISGAMLLVDNGVDGPVMCRSGAVNVTSYDGGSIVFSLALTEAE